MSSRIHNGILIYKWKNFLQWILILKCNSIFPVEITLCTMIWYLYHNKTTFKMKHAMLFVWNNSSIRFTRQWIHLIKHLKWICLRFKHRYWHTQIGTKFTINKKFDTLRCIKNSLYLALFIATCLRRWDPE